MVLYSPGRPDVHVQITGSGCEYLSHDFSFLPHDAKITRVDIACDVYDGTFTVDDVWGYLQRGQFMSTSSTFFRMVGLRPGSGDTVYIGSTASERRFRLYDKNAEQGISSTAEKTWLRYELQLRGESAVMAWENSKNGLVSLFNGLLLRTCSILMRTPENEYERQHKSSVGIHPDWSSQFDDDMPLILGITPIKKTLNGLCTYIKNCSAVLKMFRGSRPDFWEWLNSLMDEATLKDKQKALFVELLECFRLSNDYLPDCYCLE